jgi:hypothetical protein
VFVSNNDAEPETELRFSKYESCSKIENFTNSEDRSDDEESSSKFFSLKINPKY